MIKIGSFQPGNVCGDLEQMFKHRQRAADDCCGNDSIADGESALQPDHSPIVSHREKPVDWSDQTKCQRQQPNGEPNTHASAN